MKPDLRFNIERADFNFRTLPGQAQDDVFVLLLRCAEAGREVQHQGRCTRHDLLAIAETLQAMQALRARGISAVGRGAAVPHARLPGLSRPFIAVGRFAKPVPGPTPDNVPVRLVFLILTPVETPVIQLKILQRIASLVMNENLRRKLWRAKTDEALLEILRTGDTLLAS